jgi:hypothetical protein
MRLTAYQVSVKEEHHIEVSARITAETINKNTITTSKDAAANFLATSRSA